MYMLEGVSSVANFITAYEVSKSQDSHFLIRSVFFVSKCNLFDIYSDKKIFSVKKSIFSSCDLDVQWTGTI